jgi:hypothetical protein
MEKLTDFDWSARVSSVKENWIYVYWICVMYVYMWDLSVGLLLFFNRCVCGDLCAHVVLVCGMMLQLVLSSDKLSALRKPTLLLKLDVQSADGSQKEKLIELSAEETGELLNKLRAAQAVSILAITSSKSPSSITAAILICTDYSEDIVLATNQYTIA